MPICAACLKPSGQAPSRKSNPFCDDCNMLKAEHEYDKDGQEYMREVTSGVRNRICLDELPFSSLKKVDAFGKHRQRA
jgi:hypothetical protein